MLSYIFFIIVFNSFIIIFKKKIFNKISIIDYPNKNRKIHKNRSYLGGGIVIFINIILFYLFFLSNKNIFPVNPFFFYSYLHEFSFLISVTLIFCLGLYDDKYDLSPYTKTFIQLLILYILIEIDDTLLIKSINLQIFDTNIKLNDFSLFFTLICFFALINAMNMFDGINLQLTIFTLFLLSMLVLKISNYYLILIIAIPLFFFILLNYNGFSFLGNSGAFVLSFLIGYILLKNYNSNIGTRFTADEILLLFTCPSIDMLRLFFYRIAKGKNPFLADKKHIHHILLHILSEKKTVLIIFFCYSIPNFLYFILNIPLVYCIFMIIILYLLIFKLPFLKNNKVTGI